MRPFLQKATQSGLPDIPALKSLDLSRPSREVTAIPGAPLEERRP
jgi:hypothetical protein